MDTVQPEVDGGLSSPTGILGGAKSLHAYADYLGVEPGELAEWDEGQLLLFSDGATR
jgi:hypothetical protein